MPYFKPAIGKTPFFTNNGSVHIEHGDCQALRKKLAAHNIVAVVRSVPGGCSVVSRFPCNDCIETVFQEKK